MNRSEFLSALTKVLDKALEADGASFGNIQRVVPERGVLEIVVQRGFDASFLKYFTFVSADDETASGRAFRLRQRVAIADVLEDPWYGPYVHVAIDAGYRAVQSTPILGVKGDALGVLSTHFREVHHLTREATRILDDCARKAALIMMELDRETVGTI